MACYYGFEKGLWGVFTLRVLQQAAFVWFIFLVFIIMFGFLYGVLMKPVSDIHNMFYNDSALSDDVYQTFFLRTQTIWYWFPLIAVMVLIIWAFLKTQEDNPYYPGG